MVIRNCFDQSKEKVSPDVNPYCYYGDRKIDDIPHVVLSAYSHFIGILSNKYYCNTG